ncbi:MAG: endonuclease III domain-containing protein [Syntrophales bacterium]|nr:endonuclease III domain-containing protein [Syntrophales bacterium]
MSAYELLNAFFGNLNWWPGESPIEIIIGAILTQNTSWRNVEKAISEMKSHNVLSISGILDAEERVLANLIRPSGYYNIKAARLKAFCRFVQDKYDGSLEKMFTDELLPLRKQLIEVKGIGDETADCILLYSGRKPIFVVDTYTRRILLRHGAINEKASYGEVQELFMQNLPPDISSYNQYHALFVETGKQFCLKKVPRCESCPLGG